MLSGEENSETFLAEVVSSSRVTIPKSVRRKLKIVEGNMVYIKMWKEKEEEPGVSATKTRFERV